MHGARGWHDGANGAGLSAGRHVCMVFDDDDDYRNVAAGFLAGGNDLGEKTVVFGPHDCGLRADLEPLSAVAADPYVAVLGRGRLDADAMLDMFREQSAQARREGFRGLRVAADMDWLLPARAPAADILTFEARLDRVLPEAGATVLCAYRRGSFDRATVTGMLCVHPSHMAHDIEPPFKLVAGDRGRWLLSGAVDVGTAPHLTAALRATVDHPWVLDAADLEFIDVAGMRTIALAAQAARMPLELRGARPSLRRHWQLAGFDALAPGVHFTS